jgi:hypothetical protein
MSSPRASERATTSENELRDRRVLLVFDLNGLFVERVEGTVFAEEDGRSDDAATSKDGTDAPVSSRTRHAGSLRIFGAGRRIASFGGSRESSSLGATRTLMLRCGPARCV